MRKRKIHLEEEGPGSRAGCEKRERSTPEDSALGNTQRLKTKRNVEEEVWHRTHRLGQGKGRSRTETLNHFQCKAEPFTACDGRSSPR